MKRLGTAGVLYFLVLFTVLGALLMHEIPSLWHAKFYLDGQALLESTPRFGLFAGSYGGTAWLFKPVFSLLAYLGVDLTAYAWRFDGAWYLANLIWALPYLGMVWLIAWRSRLACDGSGLLVLFSVLVLYAPFYGSINKDVVPMTFTMAACLLLCQQRVGTAVLCFVLLAAAYGLVVRSYFLLLAMLVPLICLLGRSRKQVLLASVAGVVVLYLVFPLLPRALIDIGRASYLEGIAATRIAYWFNDYSAAGFVLNRCSAMLRIAFPLELLHGSPAYAPFVVFRCYASWLMLRGMAAGESPTRRVAASLILAFSIVQAVFEPDFGSAFRHFMAMVPAVVFLQATRSTSRLPAQRAMPGMC